MIDIRRLKGFTSERLHSSSRVRNVLLSEREQLTVNDFLTKRGHLDNAIQPRDGKLVENDHSSNGLTANCEGENGQ